MRNEQILAIVMAFLIASAGCAGEEKVSANKVRAAATDSGSQAEDTTLAPSAQVTATADTTVPEQPPDVFRGYLVLEPERRLFQACGATERSWIIDLTGQELTDVYAALSINPGDPIFVEFQGLLEPPPDVGFGADYANQIKVLELRRAALEGPGCNEDLRSIEFRARGNEPFWSVDILQSGIVFSDFGRSMKLAFPYTKAKMSDGKWRYVSIIKGDEDHRIVIDIERESCSDTMSGAYFSLLAEVEVDGRTYVGCATEGLRKSE
jgi:putative lipoprotein